MWEFLCHSPAEWVKGFFVVVVVFVLLFRTTPEAYGGFQARGLIRATATSLRQSQSNAGSELRPTPQLTATPDP